MDVLTYVSSMDTAYVRGNLTPKIAGYKVQYLSWNSWWWIELEIADFLSLLSYSHQIH